MVINFMAFDDEATLRQALEQHLQVGSATVEDVLLFCEENKLTVWGPNKIDPKDPERMRKHEVIIGFKTPAPSGAEKFFKLSNWKIILRFFFRLWQGLFFSADWRIEFYFDQEILSEIYVAMTVTSF